MLNKNKKLKVIGVIFLCLIGLIQGKQGKLSCQLRYKTTSTIFDDNDLLSSDSIRTNVPNEDWFTAYSNSIVNIVNTRNKQAYKFNIN